MVALSSAWKEIEWWQDSTNDPDQKVRWRVIARCTENTDENYSNVYFYIQKRITNGNEGHAYYPATKSMAITTGSESTYHSATISWSFGECRSTEWADASGTYTDAYWGQVYHNDDGTASITAHITGDRVNASFQIDTYVTLELPTIPRASHPTVSTGALVMGNSLQIATNRASSSFTHTITVSCGGHSVTYNDVETSVQFVAGSSEWMPYMTSKDMTATVSCTTYKGSTQIGSVQSTSFVLKVDTSVYKPVITAIAHEDTNTTTTALTGDSSTYIKYKSNLSVSVTVGVNNTGYGSALTSATVETAQGTRLYALGGTSDSFTYSLAGLASTYFKVTVSDNRGVEVSQMVALIVLPYDVPRLSAIETKRVNDHNEESETGTCLRYKLTSTVYWGSFGQTNNSLKIYSRYKLPTQTDYSAWALEQTINTSGTGEYKSYEINGLSSGTYSSASQFDVQIMVADELGNAWLYTKLLEGIPVVGWGPDHFDVYGTLHVHDREAITNYLTINTDSLETVPVTFSGAVGGSVDWKVFKFGNLRIATCKWTSASNVTIGSSWATIMESADQNTPNFPFTFSNVLHKSIKYVSSANAVSADCWNAIDTTVSNTNGGKFYLVRPNDSGSVTANSPVFTMLVIGTI